MIAFPSSTGAAHDIETLRTPDLELRLRRLNRGSRDSIFRKESLAAQNALCATGEFKKEKTVRRGTAAADELQFLWYVRAHGMGPVQRGAPLRAAPLKVRNAARESQLLL